MTGTILVAVNDSPAAFAAARVAIEYAKRLGAGLTVVTVVEEGDFPARFAAIGAALDRRELAADAVLKHVVALGAEAQVSVEGRRRVGRVAASILDEARAVDAILIVMATVDKPGHVIPSLGSHTLRVLEFATVPVLVVPNPSGRPA